MPDLDIIVSQLPSAVQDNSSDLVMLTQPNAQAETGYSTAKETLENIAKKSVHGIEYEMLLANFPSGKRNPTDALNVLNDFIQSQLPVNTASGSIATFSTSLALPLVAMSAEIVAQQAGSGTPSPTNVRNISGFDEVEIKHCGKNLFDPTISSNINTVITIWGLSDINIVAFFNKLPVGNYKFSFKIRVDAINGSSAYKYGIILANSSSGNITMRNDETNVEVGSIFERSANVNITNSNKGLFTNFWFYCGRSIAEGTDKCTFYDFQLELGNTQTTYEPYNGETKTIALPETIYGGEVDVVSGQGKSNLKTYSFSSALYYGTYGSANKNLYYVEIPDYSDVPVKQYVSPDDTAELYSNIFTKNSMTVQGMKSNEIRTQAGVKPRYFYFRADEFADLTALNAFLANTPLQVVAELQTPTEITGLTPANFTTFAGEQNIFADCGDISVSFKQGIQEYIDAKIAETQALILNS